MALKNVYHLNVDIKEKYDGNLPKFRMGDSGVLVFTLYDDGILYPLPNSSSATLYQITSKGNRFNSPCTIRTLNGVKVIEYEFKKTDTLDKGYNTAILVINDGNTLISIQPFEVIIYDDLQGGEGSFIELIQDLENLIKDLNLDPNDLIPLSQKGRPNGVATLDSNGKIPLSQIPNEILNLESHITETVFKDEVHGMRIKDGVLQIKTPNGYINAGSKPIEVEPYLNLTVNVVNGIAYLTYSGTATLSTHKWLFGDKPGYEVGLLGNDIVNNNFKVVGEGFHTIRYVDTNLKTYTKVINVTRAMLPKSDVSVEVNDGVATVDIEGNVLVKRIAKGERDLEYFRYGGGETFNGNTYSITEVGTYTLYYKLDTEFEYIYVFEVTEDMLAVERPNPDIRVTIINNVVTVEINPYYTLERYAVGSKDVDYFINGNGIDFQNKFVVTKTGFHTISYSSPDGVKFVHTILVDNDAITVAPIYVETEVFYTEKYGNNVSRLTVRLPLETLATKVRYSNYPTQYDENVATGQIVTSHGYKSMTNFPYIDRTSNSGEITCELLDDSDNVVHTLLIKNTTYNNYILVDNYYAILTKAKNNDVVYFVPEKIDLQYPILDIGNLLFISDSQSPNIKEVRIPSTVLSGGRFISSSPNIELVIFYNPNFKFNHPGFELTNNHPNMMVRAPEGSATYNYLVGRGIPTYPSNT